MMREREPNPTRDNPENQPHWQIQEVAETLGVHSEATQDIAFGHGHRLELGETTSLELYPASGVARLTSASARIELFRQDPPRIGTADVLFEHHEQEKNLELSVTATGDITLWISPKQESPPEPSETPPPEPSETPPEAISVSQSTELPEGVQTPVLAHSGGAERDVFEPSQTVAEMSSKNVVDMSPRKTERQPRLTVLGRVGTEPHFRTLPSGTLMASFRLAVHDEEGKTTWRTIRAFGKRAETLQQKLTKGDLVEVIGYLHEKQKELRDGQTKIVQEIYAAVVKGAKQTSSDAS